MSQKYFYTTFYASPSTPLFMINRRSLYFSIVFSTFLAFFFMFNQSLAMMRTDRPVDEIPLGLCLSSPGDVQSNFLQDKEGLFFRRLDSIRNRASSVILNKSCFISHAFKPRALDPADAQDNPDYEYFDQFYRFLQKCLRAVGFDITYLDISDIPGLAMVDSRIQDFCKKVNDVHHVLAVLIPLYKRRYETPSSGVHIEYQEIIQKSARMPSHAKYYIPILLHGDQALSVPSGTPLSDKLYADFRNAAEFYAQFFDLLAVFLIQEHAPMVREEKNIFERNVTDLKAGRLRVVRSSRTINSINMNPAQHVSTRLAYLSAVDLSSNTVRMLTKILNAPATTGLEHGAVREESFADHQWKKAVFRGSIKGTPSFLGSVSYTHDLGIVVSFSSDAFPGQSRAYFDKGFIHAASHGYPGVQGEIHHGCLAVVSSCYDNVVSCFRNIFHGAQPEHYPYDIYVIGQGFGAAVAKLFALKYQLAHASSLLPNQIKIVAFSSMNLGDKTFVEDVESHWISKNNVLNFYYKLDPVKSMLDFGCRGIGFYIHFYPFEAFGEYVRNLFSSRFWDKVPEDVVVSAFDDFQLAWTSGSNPEDASLWFSSRRTPFFSRFLK